MSSTPVRRRVAAPASAACFLTVGLAALLGASCGSATAPRNGGDAASLRAVASGNGRVAVTNRTAAPVFTFVVGRETATLVNWSPCADAARCAPLAPDATRQEAFRVTTPSGGREHEALVYWWHAVPGAAGGARPDSVRAIIVGL